MKRKKKICVLSTQTPFMHGGAEIHVNAIVTQLRKRNFDAELVQLPFKWYPCTSLQDSMLLWRFLDLSESNGEKIDLVIATKFPTYLAEHDNKLLWLIHQHRPAYDLYANQQYSGLLHIPGGPQTRDIIVEADNRLINQIPVRYANSKNVANRLKEYNNIDAAPLYHPPALEGRYFCGAYGDYIVSVGRLDTIKRNELLIAALRYCDRKITAKIAGRGTELERLQQIAKENGVQDRVEFLGFVPDEELLELYANAFGVFFAPIDEDYGYITLEAFLSRKPVVTCSDSGGVLEFVTHRQSGLVAQSNEPKEIGAAINELYQNKELCKNMGEAGYSIVKDINWDRVVDCLTQTL